MFKNKVYFSKTLSWVETA